MVSVRELNLMNETMLIYLKNFGKSTNRNEIIRNILKDEACFFKVDKEDAYIILEDIGIQKNQILNTYLELTSNDEYIKLKSAGKIKDEEAKQTFTNEIFRNKREAEIINTSNKLVEYKENLWTKIIEKIMKFFCKK